MSDKGFGWFSATLVLALAGCATLVAGTRQNVTIDTMNAKGAECRGVQKARFGDERIQLVWAATPSMVMLERVGQPIEITCKKAGFKDTSLAVEYKTHLATVGNILLGGGIGLIVDAVTGAYYYYPDIVKVPMEPVDGAPEAEKDRHKKAVAEKEKWLKEQEEKLHRELNPPQ